jgi:hypothetical protein
LVVVIAALGVMVGVCVAQEKKEQNPETTPVVTKYDKMDKKALQEELKDLQKQVIVAKRTAEQAKEIADEAAKAYRSASDDEKPDALLRALEAKAASRGPMQMYKKTTSEFQAAQSAYMDLLIGKTE